MDGLHVEHIYKTYQAGNQTITVNKDICFHAAPGSLTWVYGNSGAGKSTFLNIISGIEAADSGSVCWNNTHIQTLRPDQRSQFRLTHFGLIFQFFELIASQTVYSNAALPLKIQRRSKQDIQKILLPLFERFDLLPLIHKKPNELSGGEKQRVSIVRALSTDPYYIIADEITASLDIERSCQVYQYLRQYLKEKNGIGIFVSHDPVIRTYTDCTYKMQEGVLVPECYQEDKR